MKELPSHWFVIRLSALGDVALLTGVLSFWQRTRGWIFSVITRASWAPLLERHPAVADIVSLEDLSLPTLLPLFRRLASRNREAGLLDLHGNPRSRLLSLLWQGPVRRYDKAGLARRAFLLSGGSFFAKTLGARNVPQRYACAVEKTAPAKQDLLPHIVLSPEELARGKELAQRARTAPGRPLIALHPCAAHPNKTWPPESWKTFMEHLDRASMDFFLVGQGRDNPFGQERRDFINQTSLRETCALLAAADALVTGDSGPMHLAGGVGTPVVALFGPTCREWGFFPAGPADQVVLTEQPCRPCSLHGGGTCRHNQACMREISPEQVLQSLDRALAANHHRAPGEDA